MDKFQSQAETATGLMRALFAPTPLQHNVYLSEKYNCQVILKREDLSPVRSYKIRGAFNAMRKAMARDPEQTLFVCASAGNHAQGLAYVCRHFNTQGVVFMPVTTPQQKIMKTRAFGGEQVEVRLEGDYFDETLAAAKQYCQERGATFLAPYDDHDVIEGQASVAVELLDQLDGQVPDMIILPVGGGGLSSGVVKYFRAAGLETEFRFIEPAGAASLKAAVTAGQVVTLNKVDNFVDGASVARIGDLNFEVLRSVPSAQVCSVPEGRLCGTIGDMLNVEGIVLEPAGALTVDALRDFAGELAGKRVVCVTSGGNFDFERLPDVKERALKFEGLKKYFILKMPQRPGALRDFLNLLGPDDDISRFEYLKKSARNFGSILLGVETTDPDGFDGLCARMRAEGLDYRDITDDEIIAELLI